MERGNGRPKGRRYATDTLAISYTPNALDLGEASMLAERVNALKMLVKDNLQGDLSFSEYEIQATVSRFEHQVPAHEYATRHSVQDALPDYDLVHFSCHGRVDFDEPLSSRLLMADGELTSRDLMHLRLKGIRLAALSACETEPPGIWLQDEAVHLPNGLLRAGSAGVAASLWEASDLSAMMLMAKFYENWREKNQEPPEALRQG